MLPTTPVRPWILPAVAAAAFALGAAAGRFLAPDDSKPSFTSTRQSQSYKYVSPLIDCEGVREELTTTRPMKLAVEKIVESALKRGDATHVSVYFRDLQNGPWFGINERERFAPAGLLQLPMLMGVLKMADAKPEMLGQKLPAPWGTSTLWDVVERMITQSDTAAVETLWKHLPSAGFNRIYSDLGMLNPDDQNFQDYIRVKDYASLFRILFNGSYITPARSEKGLELLTRADFRSGLIAGVPKEVPIAHKSGHRLIDRRNYQLHDCGIVYIKSPFLLCVMTRGTDASKMSGLIAEIARASHAGILAHKQSR